MIQTITKSDIESRLIHRHENLLIDSVFIDLYSEKCAGTFDVTISDPDPEGRHIFLKTKKMGQRVIIATAYMEILALASIVCSGQLKPGEMVIFTGISQFKKYGDLLSNVKVEGNTLKLSEKKGFMKYHGQLTQNGVLIGEGQMTAFFTQQDTQNDSPKYIESLPDLTPLYAFSTPHAEKSPWMTVCDHVISIHDDAILTDYTYPTDHPLIKGHFPSNPLMMGIMQWMSLEDALYAYCLHHKRISHFSIQCDAIIFNDTGVLIAEYKGVTASAYFGMPEYCDQVEITETQRLIFRSMVKPGQRILTQISNIVIL